MGSAYAERKWPLICCTTREHVDAPAPADPGLLDPHNLLLRRVCKQCALLEPLAVSFREQGTQVALVLHAPRKNRRPRAMWNTGVLLALRNNNLVLDRLVDHVQLVFVTRSIGVRRKHHHNTWLLAVRGDRLVIYADGG